MNRRSTTDPAIGIALRHHQAGEFSEAGKLCREAIARRPDHSVAWHVLGIVLAAMQKPGEAIEAYRQAVALTPDVPEIHNNLGAALAVQGQFEAAIAAYQRALSLQPDYPDALINLGASLAATQKLDEAIETYRQALRRHPGNAAAYNNLGAALAARREFEEAIAAYQRALVLRPDYADAYNNLGVACWEMKQPLPATEAYRSAIRINPRHAEAYNNLGNCFLGSGQIPEAIAAFRESLRLRPEFVDALCNLGIALMEDQAYDEARRAYEQALQLAPAAVEPHWNIACHALLHGDFRRGWLEYEWRWRTRAAASPRRNYPQPTWCGEPLNGRTILLYTEQGFGDCIQFIRYASRVARAGGKVVLHCNPELERLMHGVPGISQVVTAEPLPPFDLYCPLLTLPLVFSTQLESIPADVPYLRVDPELASAWEKRLQPRTTADALKVGLVWAGGAGYRNDRKRSLALAQLAPLGGAANVVFYSLQKGEAATQAADPPPGLTLVDLTADLHDFADTAALISHLDLVIAVDTSVAHLAGALGRPVWLMLPTNPDWRWMLNRDDTPWYPTMRLFRQTRRGEWSDVIERVAAALAGLGKSPPAGAPTPQRLSTSDAIALAYQHYSRGQFAEAAGIYRQILAQQPRNANVLHLMGLAALGAQRPDVAGEWIARAAAVSPAIPEFQHDLGRALSASGKYESAIEAYANAIRLNPSFPDAHYNLGNALCGAGRFSDAIDAYRQAIALRPEHGDAHVNLGSALARESRFDEAISAFGQALRLQPGHADARVNIGLALMRQRQLREATSITREAIALEPANANAHWLLAALSLLQGDMETGWREYEWRGRRGDGEAPRQFSKPCGDGEAPRQFSKPRWDGSPLAGRTILLHAEQGFGDTIQFIRYAPRVASLGGRVIVECAHALSRLVKSVPGVEAVFPPAGAPRYDVHCPLMSLPLVFGTRLETIPNEIPYVRIEPPLVEQWRRRIASLPGERRIGLVWAGRREHKDDRERSISLRQLAPLAGVPGVTYISLQKGPAASQANAGLPGEKLFDPTPELNDFADTAALLGQLDLVISVDTAVAHLAGALGRPVWLMLPYVPDWRWMLDRDDTPWYPTMRLFRQTTRGDWPGVISRIRDELMKQ